MTPDTFESELQTRLGRNYRLRRALTAPRWCIEQKVSRAYDYPANDDRALRLREGYHLVLDTPDSDQTTCPKCYQRVTMPVFVRAEFDCPHCERNGVRSRMVDGYFPLVDKTLLYLERTSPRRGKQFSLDIDEANRKHQRSLDRDTGNLAEDLALDAWNRISGVLQFGRTGANTPHRYGRDD